MMPGCCECGCTNACIWEPATDCPAWEVGDRPYTDEEVGKMRDLVLDLEAQLTIANKRIAELTERVGELEEVLEDAEVLVHRAWGSQPLDCDADSLKIFILGLRGLLDEALEVLSTKGGK